MKRLIIMMLVFSSALFAEDFIVYDEEVELDYADLQSELMEYPKLQTKFYASGGYSSGNHVPKADDFLKLRASFLGQKIRNDKKLDRIEGIKEFLTYISELPKDQRESLYARFVDSNTSYSSAQKGSYQEGSYQEGSYQEGSYQEKLHEEFALQIYEHFFSSSTSKNKDSHQNSQASSDLISYASELADSVVARPPLFFRQDYTGDLYGSASSLTNVAAQSSGDVSMYLTNRIPQIAGQAANPGDLAAITAEAQISELFFNFASDPVQLSNGYLNTWYLLNIRDDNLQTINFESDDYNQLISEDVLKGSAKTQAGMLTWTYLNVNDVKVYFSNDLPDFDYLSWGLWIVNAQAGGERIPAVGTFAVGSHLTTVNELRDLAQVQQDINYWGEAMALRGSASNTGVLSGSTALTVNFHTGRIHGDITFNDQTKISLQNGWINNGVDGGIYQGQAQLNGSGTGSFQGRFHGPNAQETGGSFSVNGTERISGSFVGKKHQYLISGSK